MSPASQLTYRSPYASEAEDEINVYDPTLDPENIGNAAIGQGKAGWWQRGDAEKWWEHGNR
jgi:hypothetical protein